MHRTINEEKFAAAIKDHCRINLLNDVRFNMSELLNNLQPLDPPDFVYNEHFFEKFEVDAFEKFETRKGKKASLEKRNVDKMRARAKSPQDIFQTIAFKTPLELSNTKHLKKNIEDMIEQKTQKLSKYSAAYPAGVFRNIIVELVTRIDVLIDNEGNFFDKKVDRNDLLKVKYQVYRDLNFMIKIQEKFKSLWDIVVFVEKIRIKGEVFFIVHCFDLKKDISHEKMINYPETIFQLCHGGTRCLISKGKCSTTNIYYSSESLPNSLRNFDLDSLTINDIILQKHQTCDSVYVSSDELFYFESSQLICAIDPDLLGDMLYQYIKYLTAETMKVSCEGIEYILTRKTPVAYFYYTDDAFEYFKKNSDLAYVFKNQILYNVNIIATSLH